MTLFDRPHRTARRADRAAGIALLLCGGLAIGNLPHDQLPAGWLLAWTLPAALFGSLRRRSHRPWLRTIAASLAQIVAFALALEYAGSLSRPAVLACTILPPLSFVIVRRRDSDAALGLFLSFCVLLVGVILGGANPLLLAAYGVAACLSLRLETHLAARAATLGHRPAASLRLPVQPVVMAGLAVALPCLFVAFAIDRTLAWVPSPVQSDDTPTASAPAQPQGQTQTGLDDSFDLGGGGVLADLAGEELVVVRTDDRSPVPTDLYLRSGFFAVPEMERWLIGRVDTAPPTGGTDHLIQDADPGGPVLGLEIERFQGARNFVFVPPHAVELRGVPELQIDRRRLWLRQRQFAEQTDYFVSYQTHLGSLRNVTIDQRLGRELGLLELPETLVHTRYEQLMDDWGAYGSNVHQVASTIAAGLGARCRYDRIEPIGPYVNTIDNFLFHDGDKRGYCMHFATAAALMLRLRGIPCRIGVGLYGGDPDRRDPEARSYGSQHAHAWVEILVRDRGYVVFDPTPPEERGQRMPSELAPVAEDDGFGGGAESSTWSFWAGLLEFVLQPWFLILVIVLAIAATMWPAGRPTEAPIVVPRSLRTARRLLVRILRVLGHRGHLRQRGQTLEQFAAVLSARQRLEPAVADAFRTYQEIRFGGYDFDHDREQRLMRGIESAEATEPFVIGGD